MTEKRFKADKYYFEIWDNDDFLLSFDQTVDLLNQLNEENEQLKQQVAFFEEFIKTGVQYEYYQKIYDENEQLKQSIKEIDDAELHLKQIILKRIDDYIWEWEDEGTPVAQVLRELRDEIKGDMK